MSTSIDFEDGPEESQEGAERAFRESEGKTFRGVELQPFGWVRRTASMSLGLFFWRLTQDDIYPMKNPGYDYYAELVESVKALEQIEEKGELTAEQSEELSFKREKISEMGEQAREYPYYDQMPLDIVKVIWLCTQPDSVCARARRNPKEFEKQIDRWAERQGIIIGGTPDEEALIAFMQIVSEISASQYKAIPPKDREPEANKSGNS